MTEQKTGIDSQSQGSTKSPDTSERKDSDPGFDERKINTYEIPGVWRQQGMTKSVDFIAAGNGFFRLDRTAFGKIVTQIQELPEIEHMEPEYTWDLPKVKAEVLARIIKFFKMISTEAYVRIYWNGKECFAHAPRQSVTGGSVRYRLDKEDLEIEKKNRQVMEIHSHVDMSPFFSTTDDNDEQQPMIYGVVGRVHTAPTCNFRAKCGDAVIPIMRNDIFENVPTWLPNSDGLVVPREWFAKIGGVFL